MIASEGLQQELLNAENLLIASAFDEASKAAEAVLMQLHARNAGLEALTRAWYVLIQAHYMQKDLQPLHRLLLQHRLPIRVLPPRVILLWALVHLELGHTARARDDLHAWLMYAIIASAVNKVTGTPGAAAAATAGVATSAIIATDTTDAAAGKSATGLTINPATGPTINPATGLTINPATGLTRAAQTAADTANGAVPAAAAVGGDGAATALALQSAHGQGERGTEAPASVSKAIAAAVLGLGAPAARRALREVAQHGVGYDAEGACGSLAGAITAAVVAEGRSNSSEGTPTGHTAQPGSLKSPGWVGENSRCEGSSEEADGVIASADGLQGLIRAKGADKQDRIIVPDTWELCGDDALALSRLFAVEIMGKARAEFSAARRWLQSEAEILTVSQVQLLLQELEAAELLRIQEEQLQTQHSTQHGDEQDERPDSTIPLLNPQLQRRWRGGAGGASSNFLTMTGEMEELGHQADWPATPAQDRGPSPVQRRVHFLSSPSAGSRGATSNLPSPSSGFPHSLTARGSAWVQLLWKGLQRRWGTMDNPRLVLLALCCALFGYALHTERLSIQKAFAIAWQKLRAALLDALGMAFVMNTNPIATAAQSAQSRPGVLRGARS